MYILMYTLASTADFYLSPSLEHMTVTFKLSESLAGVTLLAFGNGAPDIFAAISAASAGSDNDNASQQTENALQAISQLVGGAIFISSIVMLLTTFASKPSKTIQMTPLYFSRDLFFYAFSNLYILGIMLVVKEINIYISLGFFLIYFIYVVLVVVQSKRPEDEKEKKTN
jgi:solute carrier family 24 (sodium/potassium/calcium exchanger), member 6